MLIFVNEMSSSQGVIHLCFLSFSFASVYCVCVAGEEFGL